MAATSSHVSKSASLGQAGLLSTLQVVYWTLLFAVTPLLLTPNLLWTTSASALQWIAYFRAAAAWCVLIYGIVVVLLIRRDVNLSDVIRSARHMILPFKLLWGVLALILVSTFFSNMGPGVAAIGSQERADGTLMLTCWLAVALVSAELARAPGFRKRYVLVPLAIGSAATSAWVMLQALGADPLTLLSRRHFHFNLPEAAFGHSGVVEAYLALCLIVFTTIWIAEDRSTWRHLLLAALLAAAMGAAGGRAGAGGFAIAGALLAVRVFRSRRGIRTAIALFTAIAVGSFGGYLASSHAHRQAQASVAAFSGGDISLTIRLAAWRVAARVVQAYPLFGVGPDNFNNVLWGYATPEQQGKLLRQSIGFAPSPGSYKISGNAIVYSDPASGRVVSKQLNWDKAHDYYLDLAVATGVPTLVLYVTFLISVLWGLLRARQTLEWGIGLGLVSFVIWGLAWFPTVSLDPLVWGLVGTGIGLHWQRKLS